MKAAIRVGPRRVEVQEVPEPVMMPGESLVKVDAVSICGGDLLYFRGTPAFRNARSAEPEVPYIVCHEAVGTIVDISKDSPWNTGDRVVIDPQKRCGKCRACLAGDHQLCPHRRDMGFSMHGVAAERVSVPNERLYLAPKDLPIVIAATAQGLAATLHALHSVDLSNVRRALVTGPGPAGLMFATGLLAKMQTPDVWVLGRPSPRLDIAREVGAKVISLKNTSLAELAFDWEADNGYDLIVETTGSPEIVEAALACLAPKGTLLMYAPSNFKIDGRMLFRRELKVLGSTGCAGGIKEAISLLHSGAVPMEHIVTHQFDFASIQDAFELAASGPGERGNFLKAVIHISGRGSNE